jgi:dipeptidyl aminopeptidase/acylaminoacyl peptidase
MNRRALVLLLPLLAGCNRNSSPPPNPFAPDPSQPSKTISLTEARRSFQTQTTPNHGERRPLDEPPPNLFGLVQYQAPAGMLAAYLTPDPGDGKRHPAIVWITGGDCNSIDDVWRTADPNDDQTAAGYRQAGIIMMFPSLRGGNTNPGVKEGFLGEIDDVLAATDFLVRQPYVDPARVYLGGHSTGGTLVFLVAASSDRYRAVFSFGPVDDVSGYPPKYTPFNTRNAREVAIRSPIQWLHSVQSPLFVFEGTSQGNMDSLEALKRASTNPRIHFYPVRGATHFSILSPTNRLIAGKILRDSGATTNLAFTGDELESPFRR